MTTFAKAMFAGFLGVSMLAGTPAVSVAHQEKSQKLVTLQYKQVDVRKALVSMFKSAGQSLVIYPDVQGSVSVTLENSTFEAALGALLKQVDATFEVEGGIYEVMKKADQTQTPSSLINIQGPIGVTIPFMECKNADVRLVVRNLMKATGQAYSIAPDVQGTVTLSLRNVTPTVALLNVLRQADADYAINGGVYGIVRNGIQADNVQFGSDPTKLISSMAFNEADVRDVLRQLFQHGNVSYTINPEVQGTVTLSLTNVNFETALENVTRQVDATYSVEGGVYNVVRKALATVTTQPGDNLNKIVSSMDFNQADVREVLRQLFQQVGVSFTIDPTVQGTVTISLKNVTFETALENITRQVDATYRVEAGVYQIVHRQG